jgi:hypothetical protein
MNYTHVTKKASKRLLYLRQLRYAGLLVTESDITTVYKSLIHPICAYACWRGRQVLRLPNLTKMNVSKRGLSKLYEHLTVTIFIRVHFIDQCHTYGRRKG